MDKLCRCLEHQVWVHLHLFGERYVLDADNYPVVEHTFLQHAVVATLSELVEDHNVLLCHFSALLVSFVEAGMFIDDVLSNLEKFAEFLEDQLVILLIISSRIHRFQHRWAALP